MFEIENRVTCCFPRKNVWQGRGTEQIAIVCPHSTHWLILCQRQKNKHTMLWSFTAAVADGFHEQDIFLKFSLAMNHEKSER